MVVDMGEVAQFALGEPWLGREEAQSPGLVAEPGERVGQKERIVSMYLTDQDPGPVLQLDRAGFRGPPRVPQPLATPEP